MNDDREEPAPGNRNLVRIFAETLHGHEDALAPGDGLAARLAPQHWSGSACEAFVKLGLGRLGSQWEQISIINAAAAARVSGHSRFLHNLRDLWSSSANDPAERARLRAIWEQESAKIAGELAQWAADLDKLGHIEFAERLDSSEPLGEPEPPAEPKRPAAPVDPLSPKPPPPPGRVAGASEPDWSQAAALLAQAYRVAVRLRRQMLTGERREDLPWMV